MSDKFSTVPGTSIAATGLYLVVDGKVVLSFDRYVPLTGDWVTHDGKSYVIVGREFTDQAILLHAEAPETGPAHIGQFAV